RGARRRRRVALVALLALATLAITAWWMWPGPHAAARRAGPLQAPSFVLPGTVQPV
ncbi:MAG: ferric siderophore transporter TonB, partial [Burkholderiales bacterium]|nr:ferric siderophore transporter TonB [Burkholderiales bacterium]